MAAVVGNKRRKEFGMKREGKKRKRRARETRIQIELKSNGLASFRAKPETVSP